MLDIKHEEILPTGELLQLVGCCFKTRLYKSNGVVSYLSLPLKFIYNNDKKGFVSVEERSKQECINLARVWANKQL